MMEVMEAKKKEDKGSGKITHINIHIAENGYTYRAETDKMMGSKEYVYESVDGVLKAVKDDLTSPHLRVSKKKDSGLYAEAKRGKK